MHFGGSEGIESGADIVEPQMEREAKCRRQPQFSEEKCWRFKIRERRRAEKWGNGGGGSKRSRKQGTMEEDQLRKTTKNPSEPAAVDDTGMIWGGARERHDSENRAAIDKPGDETVRKWCPQERKATSPEVLGAREGAALERHKVVKQDRL